MEQTAILHMEDGICELILYKVNDINGEHYVGTFRPLFEDMDLEAATRAAAVQELAYKIRHKAQEFILQVHRLAQALSPTVRYHPTPSGETLRRSTG